jgi:ribonuclease-3
LREIGDETKSPEAMTERLYAGLEQALGYQFKKTELITQALTHRSHHHEFGDSSHNERLEFLGDAILDLCVTEIVMKLSPETTEGVLSKLRSQLVSEASLARVAQNLNIGEYVRLGRGEDLSGGRKRDSLLADTVEAVLAAIYLDSGLEAVQAVIDQIFDVELLGSQSEWAEKSLTLLTQDSKSRLQEICQSAGLGAPTYICTEVSGPDHMRRFTMALVLQSKTILSCDGLTKKEATQRAAQIVLDKPMENTTLVEWLMSFGLKSKLKNLKSIEVKANAFDVATAPARSPVTETNNKETSV